MSDELSAALAQEIQKRVESGEFTVVALAGDLALKPIAHFLDEHYGIADVKQYAIAVFRMKPQD